VILLWLSSPLAVAGQAINAKVDAVFKQWDRPTSPGCSLGVIRNGEFIYRRGYGMADLDHSIPLSPDSVFYVASMSKQFTAASIAQLVQQGKLSVDDEIQKYLPELPRYEKPILIRHLIHHTSGIRDFIVLKYLAAVPTQSINSSNSDGDNYEQTGLVTDADIFKLIAAQKGLNFPPGTESAYSNSNYSLLAEIVKRVSGKSLPDFAEENIFKPLGMVNTHYYPDLFVVVKNRAIGYAPRGATFVPVRLNNGTIGPAGVLTTVNDLLLWDRNFYQNKLGSADRKLIDLLLTGDRLNDGTQLRYAFGLFRYNYKGLNAIGHDGGFFGFKTSMNRFPDQRFTVICLCNSRNAPMDELADQVADVYLADEFKSIPTVKPSPVAVPLQLSTQELQRFAGIYWNPITEGVWMFSVKGGKLTDPAGGGSVLEPIAKNRFRVAGQSTEIVFERVSDDERPAAMLKIPNGGKPQRYQAVVAVTPSVKQLTEYVGSYLSEEISATYTFVIERGILRLKRQQAESISLTPTFADNFWNDEFGYIRFTRNPQGKVDGVLFTGGWIRRLPFRKKSRAG
jgi:CubicO group peptidase (beta-lactamase class C family)